MPSHTPQQARPSRLVLAIAIALGTPLLSFCRAHAPPAVQTSGATAAPPVAAAAGARVSESDSASPALEQAVNAPGRRNEDRARDGNRRPAEVLAFCGVKPGLQVIDLMGGSGYFTEIISRAIGAQGSVVLQNNKGIMDRLFRCTPDPRCPWYEPISRITNHPELRNVKVVETELEAPALPPDSDIVLMSLFYHDTYHMGVDRAAMNKAILANLKPGGVFCLLDHHAQGHSADRDVRSLHRVDSELVKQEVLAAGFVLDAESDLLRNAQDDRTSTVFETELRGRTDQFLFRFRKPAANAP